MTTYNGHCQTHNVRCITTSLDAIKVFIDIHRSCQNVSINNDNFIVFQRQDGKTIIDHIKG